MDRLFRSSGLMRPKWDTRRGGGTYGEQTVARALRGLRDAYHGGGDGPRPSRRGRRERMFKLTDLGNAERLVARYGRSIRWVEAFGSWYTWRGTHWQKDETRRVRRLAKRAVRRIYAEAAAVEGDDATAKAIREAITKHAKASESKVRIDAMLDLTKSEKGIAVVTDDLDRDPWLLACANGTLDLRTGALRPARREDLITKCVPVAYDPAAECPRWLSFLDRIMSGNERLIGYLQRAAGYSLTGTVGEECLFFLHGSGANGKSKFLEAIRGVLGPHAHQSDPELLLVRRGEVHPTGLAALHGKRLVTTVEVDDGRRLAEALIKQMTGGDRMAGRFMRCDWFEFEPTHKLWLAANHRPVIRGTDEGIWRRIKLVPFNVTIPKPERDPELGARLAQERAGILAWMVRGTLAWQAGGLAEPEEVTNATQDYRDEMDTLARFINDRCTLEPNMQAPAADLYAAYVEWCKGSGDTPIGARIFGRKLGEMGFVSVKSHGKRGWRGIGLASNLGDDGGRRGSSRFGSSDDGARDGDHRDVTTPDDPRGVDDPPPSIRETDPNTVYGSGDPT